jgi:hypothetical protein
MTTPNYLYPLANYFRPWNLITLFLGMLFLFAGALWSGLPDWDIPVSIIMAIPAYITAGPTMRVFLERRWQHVPYAVFWTWFTVDGTYWIYWGLKDPVILEALRSANFGISICLYAMCSVVWYDWSTRSSVLTKP